MPSSRFMPNVGRRFCRFSGAISGLKFKVRCFLFSKAEARNGQKWLQIWSCFWLQNSIFLRLFCFSQCRPCVSTCHRHCCLGVQISAWKRRHSTAIGGKLFLVKLGGMPGCGSFEVTLSLLPNGVTNCTCHCRYSFRCFKKNGCIDLKCLLPWWLSTCLGARACQFTYGRRVILCCLSPEGLAVDSSVLPQTSRGPWWGLLSRSLWKLLLVAPLLVVWLLAGRLLWFFVWSLGSRVERCSFVQLSLSLLRPLYYLRRRGLHVRWPLPLEKKCFNLHWKRWEIRGFLKNG